MLSGGEAEVRIETNDLESIQTQPKHEQAKQLIEFLKNKRQEQINAFPIKFIVKTLILISVGYMGVDFFNHQDKIINENIDAQHSLNNLWSFIIDDCSVFQNETCSATQTGSLSEWINTHCNKILDDSSLFLTCFKNCLDIAIEYCHAQNIIDNKHRDNNIMHPSWLIVNFILFFSIGYDMLQTYSPTLQTLVSASELEQIQKICQSLKLAQQVDKNTPFSDLMRFLSQKTTPSAQATASVSTISMFQPGLDYASPTPQFRPSPP